MKFGENTPTPLPEMPGNKEIAPPSRDEGYSAETIRKITENINHESILDSFQKYVNDHASESDPMTKENVEKYKQLIEELFDGKPAK